MPFVKKIDEFERYCVVRIVDHYVQYTGVGEKLEAR